MVSRYRKELICSGKAICEALRSEVTHFVVWCWPWLRLTSARQSFIDH